MASQFAMRQGSRLLKTTIRRTQSSTANTTVYRSKVISSWYPRNALCTMMRRSFTIYAPRYGGLMPDSSDPPPREAEEHDQPKAALELDFEVYHKLADQYLETLLNKLEQKQEERTEIDVDYSVCAYRNHALA
jgi:frataxin